MKESSVTIIAEAGVNHNGDVARAVEMVHAAAEAGADIVKFQTFSADRLVTSSAQMAEYQKAGADSFATQYGMLKELELSHSDHEKILTECKKAEVEFLSTGFDIEDVEYLLDLGIQRLKVPSGEITHVPYLRFVAEAGLPVILSTGMCTLEEVEDAVEIISQASSDPDLTMLHCTTAYPTPLEDVNLRAMLTLRGKFNTPVGYSDHTEGISTATAAVAMGAIVVEKHFTLDKNLPGPDHKASASIEEFAEMSKGIREIEKLMGSSVKAPCGREHENIAIARRQIVAKTAIRGGEMFTVNNVCCKRTRANTGVPASKWDDVIGAKALKDYAPEEAINQ